MRISQTLWTDKLVIWGKTDSSNVKTGCLPSLVRCLVNLIWDLWDLSIDDCFLIVGDWQLIGDDWQLVRDNWQLVWNLCSLVGNLRNLVWDLWNLVWDLFDLVGNLTWSTDIFWEWNLVWDLFSLVTDLGNLEISGGSGDDWELIREGKNGLKMVSNKYSQLGFMKYLRIPLNISGNFWNHFLRKLRKVSYWNFDRSNLDIPIWQFLF